MSLIEPQQTFKTLAMNVMSTEPCSPPQFFGVAVARVGTTLTPTEVAAAKCKMVFLQLGS